MRVDTPVPSATKDSVCAVWALYGCRYSLTWNECVRGVHNCRVGAVVDVSCGHRHRRG